MSRKLQDLRNMSRVGLSLWIDDDYEFVIIEGVKLPPGYNRPSIPVLIELPADYPLVPPGIGDSHVYVPRDLRYRGRKLKDVHRWGTPSFETPGWGKWSWLCYEHIEWRPHRDDLITFIETLRTDLTNPETK